MNQSDETSQHPQVALDMGNSLLKFGLRLPSEGSYFAHSDPEFQGFLETTKSCKL